jgi:hypothetical protein
MRRNPLLSFLSLALKTTIAIVILIVGSVASAQGYWIVHQFSDINEGWDPFAGLISDQAGNLYGSTYFGGGGADGCKSRCGEVFELSPPVFPGDAWVLTVPYSFHGVRAGGVVDGGKPLTSLVMDGAGNLYGTTFMGDTVFKLTPPTTVGAPWIHTIIFDLTGVGGDQPLTPLVFDRSGNLYGATRVGRVAGTVFKLTPPASPGGAWTGTALHTFDHYRCGFPEGAIAVGSDGSVYGMASGCVIDGNGVVFRLTPPATPGGSWTYKVLHAFKLSDSCGPQGGVTLHQGNLYGTCNFYGVAGAVFELVRPTTAGGKWTENVLYQFAGGDDGANPDGKLVFDKHGNIFGATGRGGTNDAGTIYKLIPPATPGAPWTKTTLHSFGGGTDGAGPVGSLIFGQSPHLLFGVTAHGGSAGVGTIFEINPALAQ